MRSKSRRVVIGAASAALAVVAIAAYVLRRHSLESALVRAWPAQLQDGGPLVRYALARAPRVYRQHCANCHGSDLHGNRATGAPDLGDSVRLYGDGGIGDIETTILYGIRSGHPKAHNVTDMPAEGRTHQLSPTEIADVVQYVLALSRQTHEAAAAEHGRSLFFDKGNCFDCHANDARGNADYGAPGLLGGSWLYGGDRDTLYRTIYDGRHGLCPAWIDRLRAADIRSLAVWLYVKSHRAAAPPAPALATR